jgi:hypothetical protein
VVVLTVLVGDLVDLLGESLITVVSLTTSSLTPFFSVVTLETVFSVVPLGVVTVTVSFGPTVVLTTLLPLTAVVCLGGLILTVVVFSPLIVLVEDLVGDLTEDLVGDLTVFSISPEGYLVVVTMTGSFTALPN